MKPTESPFSLPAFLSPHAGAPLGQVEPQDEFLHPPAESGHHSSTETSYYGFNIPEEQLNGEIYVWLHPVLKMMSASVYIWRGFKTSTLACEYINHYHYLPFPTDGIEDYAIQDIGLKIKVLEPLRKVHIDFEDVERGVSFSLTSTAIMPPAVRPDGFHFTQAVRTEGRLKLYGQNFEINGYFSRDRSWSQERRETSRPMPPLTWMVGVFDDQFAFHVLAFDDPACGPEWTARYPHIETGKTLIWGYIFRDGELVPVSQAAKLTTREADGLSPRLLELNVEDAAGRTYDIRGYVNAIMPWQTWQNMNVYFCQTRWECDGKVGWGDSQDIQYNDFVHQFGR